MQNTNLRSDVGGRVTALVVADLVAAQLPQRLVAPVLPAGQLERGFALV